MVSVSPHNLKLFEKFLILRKKKFKFINSDFLYSKFTKKKCILLRHDLDYDPSKLYDVIELEKKYKIVSDIHVMTDDSNYKIKPYVYFLKKLINSGFHIGLHTNAPQKKEKLNYFELEIRNFYKFFKFYPKTFSIHGPSISPKNWQEKRNQFLLDCKDLMSKYHMIGSHNISGINYWVEDSGVGGEFSYVKKNFFLKELNDNEVLGVLMHPDHWIKWDIEWQVKKKCEEHNLISEIFRNC